MFDKGSQGDTLLTMDTRDTFLTRDTRGNIIDKGYKGTLCNSLTREVCKLDGSVG